MGSSWHGYKGVIIVEDPTLEARIVMLDRQGNEIKEETSKGDKEGKFPRRVLGSHAKNGCARTNNKAKERSDDNAGTTTQRSSGERAYVHNEGKARKLGEGQKTRFGAAKGLGFFKVKRW